MRIVTRKEAFGRYVPDEHHPTTLAARLIFPGESA